MVPSGISMASSTSSTELAPWRRTAVSTSVSRIPSDTMASWSVTPSRTSWVSVPSIILVNRGLWTASRTRPALSASSTTAPMPPPSNELSGPITAFCTTFDSNSSTTRSKEFSWARSRFPATRSRRTRPK